MMILLIILSKDTLLELYDFPLWEGSPRKCLDSIDESIDPGFDWNWQRNGYVGGYYQLAFSHLFTLSGIAHEDYLDITFKKNKLQFPYWADEDNNSQGGQILFYDKGDIIRHDYVREDVYNSPIIPIQLRYINSYVN